MDCNSEITEKSIEQSLHNIQEMLGEIHAFIKDMKNEYTQIDGTIEMDRHLLERLLNVSESTLYRWRHNRDDHNLPYLLRDDGSTYYLYNDVYVALKRGQLEAKGFDRIGAMQRMKLYHDGIIDGLVNKRKI
jgi:hypothetical protein